MVSCDTYMGNWTSCILQLECCTQMFSMACPCCACCGCQNVKCFALACLLDSDTEGECCVISDFEALFKQPTLCCKVEKQMCCIDYRVVCPYEPNPEHPEKEEVPCVMALGGINICVDNKLKVGFCQPLSSYRESNETCVCNMDPMCLCNGVAPDEVSPPPAPGPRNSASKEISPWKEGDPIPQNVDGKESVGMPNLEDLYVFSAWCCLIQSVYWKFPEIFGGFSEGQFLCVTANAAFNKPAVLKGEIYNAENSICVSSRVALKDCTHIVCCSTVGQLFCCDVRMALPCTDDVPCMLNTCFINCCYKYSPNCACTWFSKVKDLDGEAMSSKEQ